ncbi:unnamed protein product [Lactuca virosa]|uniref:Uncharacterized protein n=1 Tax=Lactuca virosa TaxID=75947 RepID=A0AAU9LJG4_9ASTR|nr:unnamed protein product [Lactuca virosa]
MFAIQFNILIKIRFLHNQRFLIHYISLTNQRVPPPPPFTSSLPSSANRGQQQPSSKGLRHTRQTESDT